VNRGSPALINIVDMADRIHGSESTRIVTEAGPSHRSGSDEPRVLDTCCEGTSAAALQVSQPGTRLTPAAVLAQLTGTILPMTQIDWQWLTSVGTGHEGARSSFVRSRSTWADSHQSDHAGRRR
jgi:hypothetical protein